jgi:hypothetical protein
MVSVAVLQAGLTSKRTKDALAQSKRKLGGNRGTVPTKKVRARALEAIEKRVVSRAADLPPTGHHDGTRLQVRRLLARI